MINQLNQLDLIRLNSLSSIHKQGNYDYDHLFFVFLLKILMGLLCFVVIMDTPHVCFCCKVMFFDRKF